MVIVIFETHGTTHDNEARLASGWKDAELSALGLRQCRELGLRYRDTPLDAVFCSDLRRSYRTGQIAFAGRGILISCDPRLRECDYGVFTRHPSEEVTAEQPKRIDEPFPNGESYRQAAARMKCFLDDLAGGYDGKTVVIIGHRATQYGLEHWISGKPLEEVVPAPWKWQPGWRYNLHRGERRTTIVGEPM
jgi:alpha-ribazole phosphatase/probable phosphoglycerate mutase